MTVISCQCLSLLLLPYTTSSACRCLSKKTVFAVQMHVDSNPPSNISDVRKGIEVTETVLEHDIKVVWTPNGESMTWGLSDCMYAVKLSCRLLAFKHNSINWNRHGIVNLCGCRTLLGQLKSSTEALYVYSTLLMPESQHVLLFDSRGWPKAHQWYCPYHGTFFFIKLVDIGFLKVCGVLEVYGTKLRFLILFFTYEFANIPSLSQTFFSRNF